MSKPANKFNQYGSGLLLVVAILITMLVNNLIVQPYMVIRAFKPSDYVERLWLSLDKHLNAILAGDEEETLSSRLGKWYHYGAPEPRWFEVLIASWLFWRLNAFDFDHCFKSVDFSAGHFKRPKDPTGWQTPPILVPSFAKGAV